MRNGNHLPRWIQDLKDEDEVKQVIAVICSQTTGIRLANNQYRNTQSQSDEAELQGKRDDLRAEMEGIYETGDNQDNPLWKAFMRIRERVIDGRLGTFHTEIAVKELWNLKNEAEKTGKEEKANFFERLAKQINGYRISKTRVKINGGVFVDRKTRKAYYLTGIHGEINGVPIRKKAGVHSTTRSDNEQAIREAYKMMLATAAEGASKRTMEAQLVVLDEMDFRPQVN